MVCGVFFVVRARFVAVFPDPYAKRLIIFDAFWRNWPRFKVMQKLDCCSIDMVLA